VKKLDFEAKINKRITIHGIAQNAMLGAMIETSDYSPIYMEGIEEWENSILKKSIVVTGVLRRRKLAPDPVVSPKGEISHGISGESFVLENPTWTIDKS
jgi:hypothetical protein